MRIKSILLVAVCGWMLASCSSYKNVPYLQDAAVIQTMVAEEPLYDAKIMPKDLLTVTVNTTDPEAAAPFNMTVQTAQNLATSRTSYSQPVLQQYLVSNDGTIDFPVLGQLNVGGLPDWGTIYEMITYRKTYEDIFQDAGYEEDALPKKGFLQKLFRK